MDDLYFDETEVSLEEQLAKDEEESQEFKSFIQSVKPSDFEKLLKEFPESEQ